MLHIIAEDCRISQLTETVWYRILQTLQMKFVHILFFFSATFIQPVSVKCLEIQIFPEPIGAPE